MAKTPKYDAKVKEILDALKPGERTCVLTGEKWVMDEEEIGWYKKFNVPPSKLSPQARIRLMGSFLTGFQWWTNKHAETGVPIISATHPATGLSVLPDVEWSAKDFQIINQDHDANQSFLDQLYQLHLKIPVNAGRYYEKPENSISLASFGDQNSYFVLASQTKGCFYSVTTLNSENSAEVFSSRDVNQSFNIVNSQRIFNCRYLRECFDCLNSSFLFDCRNCENCFGATNKRNKKYLWFNKQLTKEEYEQRLAEVDFGSRQMTEGYLQKFNQFVSSEAVWPENFNEKCEDCIGEYMTGCIDCERCYQMHNSRECYWSIFLIKPGEENAFVMGGGLHQTYYSAPVSKTHECKFCTWGANNQNLEYCMNCYECEFCFGCVSLRRKKFCILNKQYSEGEYWTKVDEIKCRMLDQGVYGDFLPGRFSSSYFPESGAVMFFMANPEDGDTFGGHTFDPESEGGLGKEIVGSKEPKRVSEIPDHIDDLNVEDWVGVPVYDPDYDRRFAMLKPEIEFYKKYKIAPPSRHFLYRVRQLYFYANAGVFDDSVCQACAKKLVVARNKAFPERKIYCRECYLKYLETNG